MFDFLRRSGPKRLSGSVARAVERDGLTVPHGEMAQLRMIESGGRVSDRKVTRFRIFDASSATTQSLDVKRFEDLDRDAYRGLVLRSGHVERDGSVFITGPRASAPSVPVPTTFSRVPANRTGREDDAHIVFSRETPSADAAPSRRDDGGVG